MGRLTAVKSALRSISAQKFKFEARRRLAVIAFASRMFATGIEFTLILPSVWEYVKLYTSSSIFLGIVVAATSLSCLPCLPILGLAYDRTKRIREILLITNLKSIAGSIIYSLHYSMWCLLAGRLMTGIGDGFMAIAVSEVAHIYPTSERTPVLALIGLAQILGFMVGPGLNFVAVRMDFRIGTWIIDSRSSPGLVLATLWGVMFVVTFFFVKNLALELEQSQGKVDKSGYLLAHAGYGAVSSARGMENSFFLSEDPHVNNVGNVPCEAKLNNRASFFATGNGEVGYEQQACVMERTTCGLQTWEVSSEDSAPKGAKTSTSLSKRDVEANSSQPVGRVNVAFSLPLKRASVVHVDRERIEEAFSFATSAFPGRRDSFNTNCGAPSMDCTSQGVISLSISLRMFKNSTTLFGSMALRELATIEVVTLFILEFSLWLSQTVLVLFLTPLIQDEYGWSQSQVTFIYLGGSVIIVIALVGVIRVSKRFGVQDLYFTFVSLTLSLVTVILVILETLPSNLKDRLAVLLTASVCGFAAFPLNLISIKAQISKITRVEVQGTIQAFGEAMPRTALALGPIIGGAALHHRRLYGGVVAGVIAVEILLLMAVRSRILRRQKQIEDVCQLIDGTILFLVFFTFTFKSIKMNKNSHLCLI